MKYILRDREAGNAIEEFYTREEAEQALKNYEAEDKREGIYEPDFYEITEGLGTRYHVFCNDYYYADYETLEEAIECVEFRSGICPKSGDRWTVSYNHITVYQK